MPISRLAGGKEVISSPPTITDPPSGVSKPATTFSNVVLPEPLGPRIVRSSPCATCSETRSSATTSPKRLPTPSIRRSADPLLLTRGRSRFLQHPGVPQLGGLGAVLGIPLVTDPELFVEILRRQVRLHLGVDEVQRFEVEAGIAELGGVDRLLLRDRELGQHLVGPVRALRTARDGEAALLQGALVPLDLDRRALLDDVVE